jgi:hypothetical protein
VTKVTRFSITLSSLTYSASKKEARKSRHFRHSITNNNNRVAWARRRLPQATGAFSDPVLVLSIIAKY